MCGPIKSFEARRRYLLFPDAEGAIKSAELIIDSTDKWLKYVVQRVNGKVNTAEDFNYITKNIQGFWRVAKNYTDSSTNSNIYFQILDGKLIRFSKEQQDDKYTKFIFEDQFWYQYDISLKNDTLYMKNIYDSKDKYVFLRCIECKHNKTK